MAKVEADTAVEVNCAFDVGMSLVTIANKPQACFGDGYVELTVKNTGRTEITSLTMVVGGVSGVYNNPKVESSSIVVAGAKQIRENFDANQYGQVRYIRLVPLIDLEGRETICAGSALTIGGQELAACES